MDRKEWLTLVYRQANLFLERQRRPQQKLTEVEVDELEPELHQQIQEILQASDNLEDIIKYSLLKNPPPDLWYGESQWTRVLISVASACLLHDVKGVAIKILSGDLPKAPSNEIE